MKYIEINKTTSPALRAVHLDAAGAGAIFATLPTGETLMIERRPSEPWTQTRPRVIEALEGAGWLVAGNPGHRTRRPRLLLVTRANEVRKEDMSYWRVIEETMTIEAVRQGVLVDDYACLIEDDPRFKGYKYLIAEALYVNSMVFDYRVTLTNDEALFDSKVDEFLEDGDE